MVDYEQVNPLQELFDRWRSGWPFDEDDENDVDLLEAARAALETVEGVKPRVKPLVWREEEPEWWSSQPEGIGFGYEVRMTSRQKVRVRFPGKEWEPFGGYLDDAKAAAQADYKARILSTLTTEGDE